MRTNFGIAISSSIIACSLAQMSLYTSGYRRLLKSAMVAFRGDLPMIKNAKVELRKHFFANKDVKDSDHLLQLARDVDDLEEVLRFRIVQGTKNTQGNFGKSEYLPFLLFLV